MAELKEKLFSEFAPVSTEEWMAKITADLKGVPFEKKLVWKTGEGFNVNPFYRAEDIEGLKTTESLPGEFPYVRGTKKDNDWKVRQNIEVTCFKGANEKALDILNKGVTSLGFIIKGSDVNAENIATLLDGICPECVELNFNTCNCKAEMLIGILADYFKGKGKLGGSCCRCAQSGCCSAGLQSIGSECLLLQQCRCLYLSGVGICIGLGKRTAG